MRYFVTGGTGFLGRFLVQLLLQRGGQVFLLVRDGAGQTREGIEKIKRLDPDGDARTEGRLILLQGDITRAGCDLDDRTLDRLRGQIDHFYHLAALYDLRADPGPVHLVNVAGTAHALALAESLEVGCFHLVSSIAAAGNFQGLFSEEMEGRASATDHAYACSKRDAEALVREHARCPWRIYRPGIIVGHSRTGEIDKIDGPYLFFPFIRRIRELIPAWMPVPGIEGGHMNLVPVDYVAAALDHISHLPAEDCKCFHLVDAAPARLGEVLRIFSKAAHAPRPGIVLDASLLGFVPPALRQTLNAFGPWQRLRDQVLQELQLPQAALEYLTHATRYDCRETERALSGTSIAVPHLNEYADRLWDYWERKIDRLRPVPTLEGAVAGKVVIVTGASSGIGLAVARLLARAGAITVMAARNEGKLKLAQQELSKLTPRSGNGKVVYYPVDLADLAQAGEFARSVLARHGPVSILVNNAGRSIRRPIEESFDRIHDFERTMQLNYFGSVQLTLAVLPAMLQAGQGQVINISSIGVLANAPRFSAYVSSKAALEAFSRCAAAEFRDRGIVFTVINMPLVRTPMIEPTQLYRAVPAISPEEAAAMVEDAILRKPKRIATGLGVLAQAVHSVAPGLGELIMNTGFRYFRHADSESTAAPRSKKASSTPRSDPAAGREPSSTSEQAELERLLKSIQW